MARNFHEDLKSRWFLVDVVEGFVVVVVGFVLLLGEFLHPSIPFSFYVIESPVNLSFGFPLFLLILPLEDDEVVGEVRGDAGFLVLNPL